MRFESVKRRIAEVVKSRSRTSICEYTLATLVEAWERKPYRFDLPDRVEAIRYVSSRVDYSRAISSHLLAAVIAFTKCSIAGASSR